MAFEWKTIGGEAPSLSPSQSPSGSAPEAQPSAIITQPAAVAPVQTAAEASVIPVDPSLPVCSLHNVSVNATEKSGYNATHDAEVYNSYDTGVNSDENAVVS